MAGGQVLETAPQASRRVRRGRSRRCCAVSLLLLCGEVAAFLARLGFADSARVSAVCCSCLPARTLGPALLTLCLAALCPAAGAKQHTGERRVAMRRAPGFTCCRCCLVAALVCAQAHVARWLQESEPSVDGEASPQEEEGSSNAVPDGLLLRPAENPTGFLGVRETPNGLFSAVVHRGGTLTRLGSYPTALAAAVAIAKYKVQRETPQEQQAVKESKELSGPTLVDEQGRSEGEDSARTEAGDDRGEEDEEGDEEDSDGSEEQEDDDEEEEDDNDEDKEEDDDDEEEDDDDEEEDDDDEEEDEGKDDDDDDDSDDDDDDEKFEEGELDEDAGEEGEAVDNGIVDGNSDEAEEFGSEESPSFESSPSSELSAADSSASADEAESTTSSAMPASDEDAAPPSPPPGPRPPPWWQPQPLPPPPPLPKDCRKGRVRCDAGGGVHITSHPLHQGLPDPPAVPPPPPPPPGPPPPPSPRPPPFDFTRLIPPPPSPQPSKPTPRPSAAPNDLLRIALLFFGPAAFLTVAVVVWVMREPGTAAQGSSRVCLLMCPLDRVVTGGEGGGGSGRQRSRKASGAGGGSTASFSVVSQTDTDAVDESSSPSGRDGNGKTVGVARGIRERRRGGGVATLPPRLGEPPGPKVVSLRTWLTSTAGLPKARVGSLMRTLADHWVRHTAEHFWAEVKRRSPLIGGRFSRMLSQVEDLDSLRANLSGLAPHLPVAAYSAIRAGLEGDEEEESAMRQPRPGARQLDHMDLVPPPRRAPALATPGSSEEEVSLGSRRGGGRPVRLSGAMPCKIVWAGRRVEASVAMDEVSTTNELARLLSRLASSQLGITVKPSMMRLEYKLNEHGLTRRVPLVPSTPMYKLRAATGLLVTEFTD